MTERELKRLLKQEGWTITHGKAHDLATHVAKPGIKLPIPRHKGDIPIGTVRSILKDAGL
jgi:predicted RNA binding protein YcfA (HicA-like mRNA interferase family)